MAEENLEEKISCVWCPKEQKAHPRFCRKKLFRMCVTKQTTNRITYKQTNTCKNPHWVQYTFCTCTPERELLGSVTVYTRVSYGMRKNGKATKRLCKCACVLVQKRANGRETENIIKPERKRRKKEKKGAWSIMRIAGRLAQPPLLVLLLLLRLFQINRKALACIHKLATSLSSIVSFQCACSLSITVSTSK